MTHEVEYDPLPEGTIRVLQGADLREGDVIVRRFLLDLGYIVKRPIS